jgi:hypothetical protein
MKAFICTKNDWEYEVIDVFLVLVQDDGSKLERDIKGFDDWEWEEAAVYAKQLAETLNIEYLGDKTDT